jgi:hypothetical protein
MTKENIKKHPHMLVEKRYSRPIWVPIVLTGVARETAIQGKVIKYYEAERKRLWGLWTCTFWIRQSDVRFYTPRTDRFYPVDVVK